MDILPARSGTFVNTLNAPNPYRRGVGRARVLSSPAGYRMARAVFRTGKRVVFRGYAGRQYQRARLDGSLALQDGLHGRRPRALLGWV